MIMIMYGLGLTKFQLHERDWICIRCDTKLKPYQMTNVHSEKFRQEVRAKEHGEWFNCDVIYEVDTGTTSTEFHTCITGVYNRRLLQSLDLRQKRNVAAQVIGISKGIEYDPYAIDNSILIEIPEIVKRKTPPYITN